MLLSTNTYKRIREYKRKQVTNREIISKNNEST